jgi:hypothetical protein
MYNLSKYYFNIILYHDTTKPHTLLYTVRNSVMRINTQ